MLKLFRISYRMESRMPTPEPPRAEAGIPHQRERLLQPHNMACEHGGLCKPYLANLALSSAIPAYRAEEPRMIHEALTHGASLDQISRILRVDELIAYNRWAEWVEQSTSMPGHELNVSEVNAIHEQFGYGSFPDSP